MFVAVPSAFGQGAPQQGPPQPGALPPPPDVNDPMLAPVPRAKTEIATWEEALRHVRARSTDLRAAAANIQHAEALSRVALAGALPSLTGQAAYTYNIITKNIVQPVGVGPGGVEYKTFTSPNSNYLTGQLIAVQPVIALRAPGMPSARRASPRMRRAFPSTTRSGRSRWPWRTPSWAS